MDVSRTADPPATWKGSFLILQNSAMYKRKPNQIVERDIRVLNRNSRTNADVSGALLLSNLCVARSADTRQLLAAEQVHDAGCTDGAFQGDHAGTCSADFS